MNNAFFGHKIIHLQTVDSTNNYAAKVFKSNEVNAGTVIMSDIQTNGRGQRNKMWQSGAFENLTFSATADIKLWKINSLVDLNRLIALSLYHFFQAMGMNPFIKWPNDIMIADKKISGILIENFFRGDTVKSVIGIGINVNEAVDNIERATSLSMQKNQKFEIREILFGVINALNTTFNKFPFVHSDYIHQKYDELLWMRETLHTFQFNSKENQLGKILGTTSEGNLIVRLANRNQIFENGSVRY